PARHRAASAAHHRSDADERGDGRLQEHLRRPHHRPSRADRSGAANQRVHLPHLRCLRRRDPRLSRPRARRLWRNAVGRAGLAHSGPRACASQDMIGSFDWAVLWQAWPFLLDGLWFTIRLTAVSFAGGLVLGCALALVRHAGVPVLAQAAAAYITLI